MLRLTRLIWLSPHVYLFIRRNLFLEILWNTRVIAWLLRWTRRDGIYWWLDIFWIYVDGRTNLWMWLVWCFSYSVIIDHWWRLILIAWFWWLTIFIIDYFASSYIFIRINIFITILYSTILVFLSNIGHSFITITGDIFIIHVNISVICSWLLLNRYWRFIRLDWVSFGLHRPAI